CDFCNFENFNEIFDATCYLETESDNENEVPNLNVPIHVKIHVTDAIDGFDGNVDDDEWFDEGLNGHNDGFDEEGLDDNPNLENTGCATPNHPAFSDISLNSARILVKVHYFSDTFNGATTSHIRHMHYQEMSKKSETVPLGVILKNENIVEDMIDILSEHSEYVPCIQQTEADDVAQVEVSNDLIHPVLFWETK
uniref:Uncharacterized protein n=1 Tax=Amphimedon queenslandica TaxID=400682 RepID=A0A1X7VYH8_AMPQE